MSTSSCIARSLFLVPLLSVALTACQKHADTRAGVTKKITPATVALDDVVESNDRYVIGVSYPQVASKHPGLAAALRGYTELARNQLLQSVAQLGNKKPDAPYDLALSYTERTVSPDLITIAANGSTYTGGTQSRPLIARFVWLPKQQYMLTANELIPQASNWQPVAVHVRKQLYSAVSQRIDADKLSPAARAEALKQASRMIDAAVIPNAVSFANFEPVLAADGTVTALRFVFPPIQVGSNVNGTQTAEVPAQLLRPYVAPNLRTLFRQSGPGNVAQSPPQMAVR